MILAEQLLEFLPRNLFSRPYNLGVIPPYGCRAFEIMGGKWDFICFFAMSDVQFLFHGSQPVISLNRIHSLTKAGWFCALEVSQFGTHPIAIILTYYCLHTLEKFHKVLVSLFLKHSHYLICGWCLRWWWW